ncbi:MAG: Inosine-5'-monophosphate dehydrogenase [Chlamydiae bacterium]|nr:Inosine-5'-monophosphate dehydrogenase [Chlamydiota bacterium]
MQIEEFFQKFEGYSLTYDDLIFLPDYVDFAPESINLKTKITREIEINTPFASSPMDTVTEVELAIATALQGGLGLIHYNMSPEEQWKQIRRVKGFKSGFGSDPLTLSPNSRIWDVVAVRNEYGFTSIPITSDGKSHGQLVGMITKYDYSTLTDEDLDKTIAERMIPADRLTIATFGELSINGTLDINKANASLVDSRSPALPIIDSKGCLKYFITRSDLEKYISCPHATSDQSKRLLVGAAVETWFEKAEERLAAIHNDVDVIVYDTSQGFTSYELDLVKWTKQHYPDLQVIGGNVVTADACEALIEAGVDGLRIGMGSGSICTTQEVGGVGRGQATAVYECSKVCLSHGVPIIADGGIRKSADIIKALCLGANAVMLGSLLACTNEAPGKTHIKDGVKVKEYRGMGSMPAMERGSSFRYGIERSALRVPEGVTGMVSSRGSIAEWIPCIMQGVRQGLHKLGMKGIDDIHRKVAQNQIKIERRSEGAKREGDIHGLYAVHTEEMFTQTVAENRQPQLLYN